ncbi:MAG TPA: outer membrane protein assembly factor BamA [Gemmatimonadales bacterium]|nr:outer membrane protein assembly factor BamA [Gemmatimonadales bacterium]
MRAALALAVVAAGAALAGRPRPAAAQEAAALAGRVDSVAVEGNHRISRATIIASAAIPLRTPIGFRDVQRAVRALFATEQFDSVSVLRTVGPDSAEILVVRVTERPLLTRVTVRGADQVSERSVRDRIELPAGRPLNPGNLERARQRIDSLYEAEGYYLADVKPQVIAEDSDHVRVVLDVDEGRRIAIAAVRVEGARAFPAAEIVAHMKTRPEGFWWFRRGEYGKENVREDLEQRLPAFYGSHGYVDFRVLHDTLLVDRGNGKATLVVTVDEGRPYEVGTVRVQGNHRFSTDEVMTLNPFGRQASGMSCVLKHCGGPAWFDQNRWDDATTKLRTQYNNQGYIYAQIDPQIQRIEPADSSQPPTVNLTWNITEGRPALVNKIDIMGNDVTHERVIREALSILPGDVFAQDRVIRSYQAISNLGFFQQPLPFPDTRTANDQGDIDLIFKVQEKRTGNVNFGASMGQGTGLGGFLGLDEPNLFGEGKKGHIQWQFGANINQLDLSYTDPSLGGSLISGTFDVHDTRTRYTISDLGQITSRGASLQFGLPVAHSRYSRLFPSYAIDFESYSGNSALLAGSLRCVSCMRSTLGLTFARDTRIDMPFPTGGTSHTVSLALNGGPLGGSATFEKLDLEGHWYAPAGTIGGSGPAGGGVHLVLALSSKAGFVFGNAGPFFDQMYTMGGTQYGIPLRGYDEFSITPQGFNPTASTGGVPRSAFGRSYFESTAEFGLRFSQSIYASFFYDMGNVWAAPSDFNPTRLFRGAGFGVALVTPLGPLGLDLGYGFDKVNTAGQPAPGWKLHFKIGNFFQ